SHGPHQLRRDPRGVPVVLRGPRPPPDAVGFARPVRIRPLGAAHDGGYAAVQALLRGAGIAAGRATHLMPEVLSDDRHRRGGADRTAPHLLRDAWELLVRRL